MPSLRFGCQTSNTERSSLNFNYYLFLFEQAIIRMAAKLKDGLFIGDGDTSQSEDFINDNKISNLVNLAGRELPNLWAAHGLVYMTFNWEDRPDFKLGLTTYQTSENDFMSDVVEFIDVSIAHGISVLLFSKNGTGRCAVAACAYLMVKYRWGFEKAFEFVYSKKPDISLNRGFVQQLFSFDKHLLLQSSSARSEHIKFLNVRNEQHDPSGTLDLMASTILSKNEYLRWKDWNLSYVEGEPDYDNDEMLLLCSYINSKVTITTLPGPYRSFLDTPTKLSSIRFSDVRHRSNSVNDDFYIEHMPARKGILKVRSQEPSSSTKLNRLENSDSRILKRSFVEIFTILESCNLIYLL